MSNSPYKNLIDSLIRDGYLKTPAIIETFRKIDRADFVLEKYKNEAYINAPLPIGFGQTISQPLTVAFMLELLEPKPGEKILDIGCGSGWQTALLAEIAGKEANKEGRVVAIERIPELKEMAERNVEKYDFIKKGITNIILGDGSRGYKKEAPYDKIIAAAAAGKIPNEWKEQLKMGGRLVAPVGHNIIVLNKIGKNRFSEKEYFGFSFVPLVSE